MGFVAGVPQISANRLLVKNRSAMGSSLRHFRWHEPQKVSQSVQELFQWYVEGKLKPCVSQSLPLEESVRAIAFLTTRSAHGKVIVRP